MPASDELYPPIQYGWGWILVAVGILAALALAAWLVIALTRPKTATAVPPAGFPPLRTEDVLAQLRHEYLQQIDQVEGAYLARQLEPKQANLDLSRIVRAFVNEYSGLEAPVLALDDLRGLGVHPALIDALHRHYYPSVFRQGPAIDPRAGADAARKVVNSWH